MDVSVRREAMIGNILGRRLFDGRVRLGTLDQTIVPHGLITAMIERLFCRQEQLPTSVVEKKELPPTSSQGRGNEPGEKARRTTLLAPLGPISVVRWKNAASSSWPVRLVWRLTT